MKCVEGFGIFDYDVTVSAGYENYMGMLIGNEESGFPQELKNIVPDRLEQKLIWKDLQ